jgi:magnesium transporter
MAGFEKALSTNVAIVFFIPALVYLADAIGTQTEAIAVRGLALTRTPFPIVLLREIVTGGLIGACLGLLAVLGVWAVFGDWRLAIGVGVSLFAAGTLASAIGLTLPWLLSRFGIDPALGSGPVATIVQDVLTLLVYFVVLAGVLPEPAQPRL